MPWRITKSHPDCSGFAVVKESDNKLVGCHDTEEKAKRQLAALNANVTNEEATMREREYASFAPEMAKATVEGRTLSGYASAFNVPIEVPMPGGVRKDFIRPGAFKKTIKERRDQIMVLFNHGRDPRFGQLPIGKLVDIAEDDYGLKTEVHLHDGPDNQNIIAALNSGSLNAQSIQFEVMAQSFNDDRTERYIDEVKLHEFGPVTFPANAGATAYLHSAPEIPSKAEPPEEEGRVTEKADAPSDEGRLTLDLHSQQQDALVRRLEDLFKED